MSKSPTQSPQGNKEMDKNNNKQSWASELTMVTLILIAMLLVLPLTCARACSLAHEDGAVVAEDAESNTDEHEENQR